MFISLAASHTKAPHQGTTRRADVSNFVFNLCSSQFFVQLVLACRCALGVSAGARGIGRGAAGLSPAIGHGRQLVGPHRQRRDAALQLADDKDGTASAA